MKARHSVRSVRSRMTRLRGFLNVSGDLLSGRKPDTWLGFHVVDQLVQIQDARATTDNMRMQGKHEHRALFIGDIEILLVDFEDQFRRRERSASAEVRRVIEGPVDREFYHASGLAIGQE